MFKPVIISSCDIVLHRMDKKCKVVLSKRQATAASIRIRILSTTVKEIRLKFGSDDDVFITSKAKAISRLSDADQDGLLDAMNNQPSVDSENVDPNPNSTQDSQTAICKDPNNEHRPESVIGASQSPSKTQTQSSSQHTPTKSTKSAPRLACNSMRTKKKLSTTSPVKTHCSPVTKKGRDTGPHHTGLQARSPTRAVATKPSHLTHPVAKKLDTSLSFGPGPSQPQTPEQQLSAEQQRALEAVLAGRSVFLTGGAGSGKSWLLRLLVARLQAKLGKQSVFVTATTGLAACAVGGCTIHQFAGLGRHSEEPDEAAKQVMRKPAVVQRWRQARVLIIDEISMLSPKTLETLDVVGTRTRGVRAAMGGLQCVFVGDFFQLPPVVSGEGSHAQSLTLIANSAPPRFCFQSPVWARIVQDSFALTTAFRQREDRRFAEMLEEIRWGSASVETLATLARCADPGRTLDASDGILPTRIFTHRKDVDDLNSRELLGLPGTERTYEARDSGDASQPFSLAQLRAHCPAKQTVRLKVGAQVILVKTVSAGEGLVNGARGVVTAFSGQGSRPVVRFACGLECVVLPETFSVALGGQSLAQRSQLPLDLCWALSVHKAQGTTVDKAALCLRNTFECGQAYVALSRVTHLRGLQLSAPLTARQIRADPAVVAFYKALQTAGPAHAEPSRQAER